MSDNRSAIEVFIQNHCASCRQVERYLVERGVGSTSRNVTTDHAALEELSLRGFMATPVTRISDQWVSGFSGVSSRNLLINLTNRPARFGSNR